jgi:peroxiredoxin
VPATTITLTDADDVVTTVTAEVDGDQLLIDAADLDSSFGWTLKPQGLCRGEVCVPTAAHPEISGTGTDGRELVDLEVFARLTDQPVVVDLDEAMVTFGTSARSRAEARASLEVPDVEVSDLDGNPVRLRSFTGQKKLLVAFSSWCGCRYDLPAWQALHAELAPKGFTAIAVAVDEDPDDVREWVAEVEFPVVIDRDRTITQHFDIRNVPTVIWIDEDDRIVRPNDVAFGSDEFKEFHGVDSDPHHEALRRWVNDGELELDEDAVRENLFELTADEQLARVHWRVAIALHRQGRSDAAARHFERAGELAPHDFTISRASMPLRGIDPFLSEEFIELYTGYQEAGQPDYGFSQTQPAPSD